MKLIQSTSFCTSLSRFVSYRNVTKVFLSFLSSFLFSPISITSNSINFFKKLIFPVFSPIKSPLLLKINPFYPLGDVCQDFVRDGAGVAGGL